MSAPPFGHSRQEGGSSGDLDLASLDGQGQTLFGSNLQTELDGLPDVGQRFFFRFALADATGDRGTLDHIAAVLVRLDGHDELHTGHSKANSPLGALRELGGSGRSFPCRLTLLPDFLNPPQVLDVPARVLGEGEEVGPLAGLEGPAVLLDGGRAGGRLRRGPDRFERGYTRSDIQVHLDRDAEARKSPHFRAEGDRQTGPVKPPEVLAQ